jgi:YVTN family beta-propeller protein
METSFRRRRTALLAVATLASCAGHARIADEGSRRPLLYVALREAQEISALDARSGRERWSLELPKFFVGGGIRPPDPTRLARSPDGRRLYAACGNLEALAVVDPAARKLLNMLPVGGFPSSIAVGSDGRVFVNSSNSVAVVDADGSRVIERIAMPARPTSLALAADESKLYVITDSDELSAVDLATRALAGKVRVGTLPGQIAVRPHGSEAFVPLGRAPGGLVAVVDLVALRVVDTIAVGANPTRVAFLPDGSLAYVLNNESRSVSIVDAETRAVRHTFTFSDMAMDLAISPELGEVFVSQPTAESIAVFTLDGTPSRTIDWSYGEPKWPAMMLATEEGPKN